MKAKEKKVLVEAKKMLGRINLFSFVYDFSEEFKMDTKKLQDIIAKYEAGKITDLIQITNAFGDFTKKYGSYVEEVLPAEHAEKKC